MAGSSASKPRAPPSSSGSSSTGIDSSEEQSWDDWQDEQPALAKSLFSPEQFDSATAALQHDRQHFGVDVPLLASTLDFFERIRLINWIRATSTSRPQKPEPSSLERLDRNADFLQDDQYLKPVLQDDALLQYDFDQLSLADEAPSTSEQPSYTVQSIGGSNDSKLPTTSTGPTKRDTADLIDHLRAQLYDSSQAIDTLKGIIRERLAPSMGLHSIALEEEAGKGSKIVPDTGADPQRDDDTHYFDSYAYNDIHEVMLKDKVRTDSYRDFIMSNPQLFKDAVVLDVGCGTGILSMFAAKSGAKKVYAVDASNVVYKAQRNIKANGLSEVITVIRGKIEDLEIPEKVDIIVSEWMGYCLLYECMLDSVLSARDRCMKPTGLMVPSQTSIMLALFSGSAMVDDRVKFWDNVYGFDMSAMKEEIKDDALIDVVDAKEVVSDTISISDIVTQTTTVADLSFTSPFKLTANRSTTVNAFLAHFDTFFTSDARLMHSQSELKRGEVYFTTGAHDTPTHWKQTMFLLKEPIQVEAGTVIEGSFKCSKNPENSRELVVEVTWTVHAKAEEPKRSVKAQVWKVR
ncbi:BZ3500_MvSof-1268-A1-R1_Chr10-2g02915 [Microbotryum saponariae]|uniref:type I protein arginine methyltransferase n=1 Tax=Microbotryum saponariae TaxID=289078 RepID=A0A2X0L557_9BASI|nr:BZ3501_MvSof-1269-A2-R1_Chr10-2g02501 [Microbotryum saponariae]SDA01734.1 BZ3500_MvSof-1268-A1-R1_Chr10-2g02915 [Microbotryum saponariae]